MPQSRKSQVNVSATPYYHCISRCVRRAFLCGKDAVTGRSYEHRREWVEKKLLFLSDVFAIKVCAYAVMSNHTHTVLFIDEEEAKNWDTREVLMRWHQAFKGTLLTQQYLEGVSLKEVELATVKDIARVYQARLSSISWFMRVLNEGIARAANKEDECTGRFWEGRFKSQALLDEGALLACMAYVDLNPIRAGIAKTVETSQHTSIQRRVAAALDNTQPSALMAFSTKQHNKAALPFQLESYLELVKNTGSYMKGDKIKAKDAYEPISPLLTELNLNTDSWLIMATSFTQVFHGAVGQEKELTHFCDFQGRKRRSNLSVCRRLIG